MLLGETVSESGDDIIHEAVGVNRATHIITGLEEKLPSVGGLEGEDMALLCVRTCYLGGAAGQLQWTFAMVIVIFILENNHRLEQTRAEQKKTDYNKQKYKYGRNAQTAQINHKRNAYTRNPRETRTLCLWSLYADNWLPRSTKNNLSHDLKNNH